MTHPLLLRHLGTAEYATVWRAMQRFTEDRGERCADEVWILEHEPVYTLGLNAKEKHLLSPGDIPVIRTDRGGQVTYHGPGQLIVYPLIDLRRIHLGVRTLVSALENAAIEALSQYGIEASARAEAPGVYVDGAKIASVGLRIRRGCSYHGLSLNVHMDLSPFAGINPCGHAGLEVTQMADLGVSAGPLEVAVPAIWSLMNILGYSKIINASESVIPETGF